MLHKDLDLLNLIHEAQAMGEYGISYTLWVAAFEDALDNPQDYALVYEYPHSEGDDFEDSERDDYYDLLAVLSKSAPQLYVRIPVPLLKENYVRAFRTLAIVEERDEKGSWPLSFETRRQYNMCIERFLKVVESIKSEYDLMAKAHQYLREDLWGLYFTGNTPRVYGVEWVKRAGGAIKLQKIDPQFPRQTYAARIAEQKTHMYCSECKFYTDDYKLPCAVNPYQSGVANASIPHCRDKEL